MLARWMLARIARFNRLLRQICVGNPLDAGRAPPPTHSLAITGAPPGLLLPPTPVRAPALRQKLLLHGTLADGNGLVVRGRFGFGGSGMDGINRPS